MKSFATFSFLLMIFWLPAGAGRAASAYVRVNQAGYTAVESKKAILLASGAETGTFRIINTANGSNVFSAPIPAASLGAWSPAFPNTYELDFSSVTNQGLHTLQVTGTIAASSPSFVIGTAGAIYRPLLANALFYYQSSRDGANVMTNVLNRRPSHLPDQAAFTYSPPVYSSRGTLSGGLTKVGGPVDVSGGWFDAGDYIKLVETTSYVEGMMLFAVREYPNLLSSGVDFRTEARFGLDWLLKMWDQTNLTLYYVVGLGDGAKNGNPSGDHDVWRLPEADDQLNVAPGAAQYFIKYRPAFRAGAPGTQISPNLAGRLAASFALGSQVFRRTDAALANRCLLAAQTVFDLAQTNNVTQLLTAAPYDYYPETEWREDLEWGAAELYFATAQTNLPAGAPHTNALFYLQRAAYWAKQYMLSPNHLTDSLNLYDASALAHYELHRAITQAASTSGLAITQSELANDLNAQLSQGATQAVTDPFGFGMPYSPSSDPVPHALCYAITANLYKQLTGTNSFDAFGRAQRDWVLGRNAWGSSFIVGAGSTFPHCMQDQIANLAGHLDGTLPLRLGATVDGPASDLSGSGIVSGANLCAPSPNPFATFNGKGAQFIDNVAYWMTVEPSLDYTVPTVLLFAQLIGELSPPGLQSPAYVAHQFSATLIGTPGFSYSIQATTNLLNWVSLRTNVAPFSFTDTNALGPTFRLYRGAYFP